MLKAIKDELKNSWQSLLMTVGLGWGLGLLLDLIFICVWMNSAGQSTWSGVGSIVGLVIVWFTIWLMTLVQFSTGFALAVTMGRTRRRYVASALCANLVLGFVEVAAMLPLVWLEQAVHRNFFAALPLDGGTVRAAYPALWLLQSNLWVAALITVTAVALGMLMGALFWRMGQAGFWVIWVLCIGGGALVSYLGRIQHEPFLALQANLIAWAQSITAPGWAVLWAAACAVVLLGSWILVHRAAVK